MMYQVMTKQERDALSDALTTWRMFCALRYDNFWALYDRQYATHYAATWKDRFN